MRAPHQVLRSLLWGSLLAFAVNANAMQITLRVHQFAETDGSLNYRVIFRPSTPQAVVIAPDGTVADVLTLVTASGLTYEQLASRFFGEWTIQETAASMDVYHFTMTSLPQLPIPTILSPIEDAVLGTAIHAEWTYPGDPLPGPAMSAGSLDPLNFSFDSSAGSTQGTVFVDLGGLPSSQVFIRGGGGYAINEFISPPLLSSTPDQPYFVAGTYSSFSAPVTVTVVPEPSSAALAWLGCSGMLAYAWGRARRAHRTC